MDKTKPAEKKFKAYFVRRIVEEIYAVAAYDKEHAKELVGLRGNPSKITVKSEKVTLWKPDK